MIEFFFYGVLRFNMFTTTLTLNTRDDIIPINESKNIEKESSFKEAL